MRNWFVVFLFFSLVACKETSKNEQTETVATMVQSSASGHSPSLPFPIYDYEGLSPLLHKEDDSTYIINFWATWCKPCVAELPDFERTFAEQKKNKVSMVLVSLDMPSMWEKRLVPFVAEQDLKGEVVILDDPKMNDWIPKIDPDWEGGIPATLIYNKNKRQFYPHGFTYDELNSELQKFINN